MDTLNRLLAALLAGLILALIGSFIATILTPVSDEPLRWPFAVSFIGLWLMAFIMAFSASRPSRAWRHLLISGGIAGLLVPVAAMISAAMAGDDPGRALGGVLAIGIYGFAGVSLGAALLVAGLLTGREPG